MADEFTALLGKVFGKDALVLQSPEDDTGRIAPLFHPTGEQTFEVFAESRCIIPDMCRELTPEQHTLFVEKLLIKEVMGLVGFTESVEAGMANLLHPRPNLLVAEGMTATQQVLVLTGSIDEEGLVVQEKTTVDGCGLCLLAEHRP